MKRLIIIFICLVSVVVTEGCFKFNKSYFIKNAFDLDLSGYLKDKKTEYVDGCLQVFDVSESDPLYMAVLAKNLQQEKSGIEVGSLTFRVSDSGEIRYRRLMPDADGYLRVIFYIPRDQRLVFAYATGLGG